MYNVHEDRDFKVIGLFHEYRHKRPLDGRSDFNRRYSAMWMSLKQLQMLTHWLNKENFL
jgi:hypothetical protein